jgi:hypothetical protein
MKLNTCLLTNYGIKQGKWKDIVSLTVVLKQDEEGANVVTSAMVFVMNLQELRQKRDLFMKREKKGRCFLPSAKKWYVR